MTKVFASILFNPQITADGQYRLQSAIAGYATGAEKRETVIYFNRNVCISSFSDYLLTLSLAWIIKCLISCFTVVFVFLCNVIVRYEMHLPSTAERAVSISAPSCHGLQQASISYHNLIVDLSRPI